MQKKGEQNFPEKQHITVNIHEASKGLKKILKEAIKEAELSKKTTIFIKPNISHPEFIPGVVSDPELLAELIGLLRNDNKEVIVGESNGYNYSCKNSRYNKP